MLYLKTAITETGSVGYNIVGNPTIADGVVNNFSSSNRLTLQENFRPGNYTWTIGCKFTTGQLDNTFQSLYSFQVAESNAGRYGLRINFNASNKLECTFTLDGSTWFNNAALNYNFSANTTYWTKEYWDGTAFKFDISTDGINYTNYLNIASTTPIYNGFGKCYLGVMYYGSGWDPFKGSIDLNETYIEINNQLWFGKKPQVKTQEKRVYLTTVNKETGSVGYTEVGSPTIIDGVISNFTSSNYALLNENFRPGNSLWEIGCKFTTGQLNNTYQSLYSFQVAESNAGRYGLRITINSSNKLECTFTLDGSTWFNNAALDLVLQAHTTYFSKEYWDGTAFKVDLSTDNGKSYQNFLSISSTTPIYNGFGKCYLGVMYYSAGWEPFQGSIDLNYTYIKINGQIWFGTKTDVYRQQYRIN